MNRIYLDHAASTPLCQAAMEAMRPYLYGFYGNPSSAHEEGRRARQAIERSRERIAETFKVDPAYVFFVPSATAANNLAIRAISWSSSRVMVSPLEHPSVMNKVKSDCFAKMIPLDRYGRVTVASVKQMTVPQMSQAASVCWVCSETGVLNPIAELSVFCDVNFNYFHTDATQGVGHLPLDFLDNPPDCLTFGAHKFGGPRGVGVLIVYNHGLVEVYHKAWHNLIIGGHQESGVWPGTENTAAIVGCAAALNDAMEHMQERTEHTLRLRERLIEHFAVAEFDKTFLLNTPLNPALCAPGIVNVSVPRIDGADIVMRMDEAGIAVSSGSACSTGSGEPSPVIMAASHGDEARARGSIRFSFNHTNTLDEIDYAASVLTNIVRESMHNEDH